MWLPALTGVLLLSLSHRLHPNLGVLVFLATLVSITVIASLGFIASVGGVPTAGRLVIGPEWPLSIELRLGRQEAFVSLVVNLVGLLGGWHLLRRLLRGQVRAGPVPAADARYRRHDHDHEPGSSQSVPVRRDHRRRNLSPDEGVAFGDTRRGPGRDRHVQRRPAVEHGRIGTSPCSYSPVAKPRDGPLRHSHRKMAGRERSKRQAGIATEDSSGRDDLEPPLPHPSPARGRGAFGRSEPCRTRVDSDRAAWLVFRQLPSLKYVLVSLLFLLGVVLAYRLTGTLSIDGLIADRGLSNHPLGG